MHIMGIKQKKYYIQDSYYDLLDIFTTHILRVRITNERLVTDIITSEQRLFISTHVDREYYNVDRLIKYLSMHDIVGAEVFHYCEKTRPNRHQPLSAFFDDDKSFLPMNVNTFIRRIPFLFYISKSNDKDKLGGYGDILNVLLSYDEPTLLSVNHFEHIYADLDHMYYDLHLPLEKIFSYWINQTGYVGTKLFEQWAHYVRLIENSENPNFFPDRFITAYNYALENAGLPAIIYKIQATGFHEFFIRSGNSFHFKGSFPCDDEGKPIMKWIGLKVTNAASITCDCKQSRIGNLAIYVTPTTIIKALNMSPDSNDDEDLWNQIYAGPLNMEFDYTALRYFRDYIGYTQQQVADAIGTSVRTYQKWEAGSTIPNGFFLLKLLNWLDITDIQDVVKYK